MKRKKYEGAVQGFVVESGGRLGPAAKKFIDEVVEECGGELQRAKTYRIFLPLSYLFFFTAAVVQGFWCFWAHSGFLFFGLATTSEPDSRPIPDPGALRTYEY